MHQLSRQMLDQHIRTASDGLLHSARSSPNKIEECAVEAFLVALPEEELHAPWSSSQLGL